MSIIKMLEDKKKEVKIDFSNYTSTFYDKAREEKRNQLEKELQSKINEIESDFLTKNKIKQGRVKKYHTELGTIILRRTAFKEKDKWIIPADEILKLPDKGYSKKADELACILGITTDFVHAKELFIKWTGVEISDHGLSNHIEEIGEELYNEELSKETKMTEFIDSGVKEELKRVYIGSDGIMVPTKKNGYKEGKVGVIFSEKEHITSKQKRNYIKKKIM